MCGTHPNFKNMGSGGFRVPGRNPKSGFRVPTKCCFVPTPDFYQIPRNRFVYKISVIREVCQLVKI